MDSKMWAFKHTHPATHTHTAALDYVSVQKVSASRNKPYNASLLIVIITIYLKAAFL